MQVVGLNYGIVLISSLGVDIQSVIDNIAVSGSTNVNKMKQFYTM